MAEVYAETSRHAWIAVPLRVGDRLLGSLVAGWSEERTFPPDEVDLVQVFAAQCAQALERLEVLTAERQAAEASRRLSETLQRSLLTDPPAFEPAKIAVRYRPASAGAQIGGDWYDAFLLADGGLTLVIGDVTGHDRNAAAAMAQIRNVLRGVAQSIGEPPAAVLTQLDTALANLRAARWPRPCSYRSTRTTSRRRPAPASSAGPTPDTRHRCWCCPTAPRRSWSTGPTCCSDWTPKRHGRTTSSSSRQERRCCSTPMV